MGVQGVHIVFCKSTTDDKSLKRSKMRMSGKQHLYPRIPLLIYISINERFISNKSSTDLIKPQTAFNGCDQVTKSFSSDEKIPHKLLLLPAPRTGKTVNKQNPFGPSHK